MQLLFKQSVCLLGKDYSLGLHDIPDEVFEKFQHSKYAQSLMHEGKIVEPEFAKNIKQKSKEEEMFALAERVKNGPVDLAKDDEELATKSSKKKKGK